MLQAARQTIRTVPRQAPVYSLVNVAAAADLSEVGEDWVAGFQWVPDTCPTVAGSGRLDVSCLGATSGMTDEPRSAARTMDPFVVWATDTCTATGWQTAEYVERATRQLLNTQSFQLAAELWDGSLNAGAPNNLVLVDSSSDTVTTAALAAEQALGRVEQGIAHYGRGARGMVHVTAQVLTELVTNGSVYRSGTLWLTAMGNIVVADAGYSGNGPGGTAAGSTQWMYGTDLISVLLSPILTIPDTDLMADPGMFMAQALDRSVNQVVVYAQRVAGWVWDACVHVAAEVNLAVPAIGAP